MTDDGVVSLTFSPASPVCPLGFQLALCIQDALKKVDGVKDINIDVKEFIYADQLKKTLAKNK
jgi:metal-sulfur cluster biosynthetic enzyme